MVPPWVAGRPEGGRAEPGPHHLQRM